MKQIPPILIIIRPVNCLLAFISVLVGAILSTGDPQYYRVAISALATFMICGAGNIHNDLVDLPGDRINHPKRVLVTGLLSEKQAVWISSILTLLAIILSLTAGLTIFLIVLFSALLLFCYNQFLSKLPLVGNLAVAFLAGLTFLVGGVAMGGETALSLPGPLIPAVFAFFFHLTREIIKDCQDIVGDKVVGWSSLATRITVQAATKTAFGIFLVMVPLTILPYLAGWYGVKYLIIVTFVDLILSSLLLWTIRQPSEKRLRVLSSSLKYGMALGVVALLLA